MKDNNCIFCKIVAGEIPAEKVYEDADVLAMMDIAPSAKGHTLVIPKEHHPHLHDVPPELLAKMAAVLPKVAKAASKAVGAEDYNVLQSNGASAGQVISHVHFHVVPRKKGDGLTLGFRQRDPVTDDLAKTAEAIRAALKK